MRQIIFLFFLAIITVIRAQENTSAEEKSPKYGKESRAYKLYMRYLENLIKYGVPVHNFDEGMHYTSKGRPQYQAEYESYEEKGRPQYNEEYESQEENGKPSFLGMSDDKNRSYRIYKQYLENAMKNGIPVRYPNGKREQV